MPLNKQEMDTLADAFDSWFFSDLENFADLLNYNLSNEAPSGSVRFRAFKFISDMNSSQPPRDRELLERLLTEGNAALRAVAQKLLEPGYVSTKGESIYFAISLGTTAFLGRDDLREPDKIERFANISDYSTRVLVVSGGEPCGKSYTFYFLQHLANRIGAAFADPLNVGERKPTTREFFDAVGRKLGLNLQETGFPPAADDPQQEKIWPYLDWLDGQIDTLDKPRWLTIDELNHPEVKNPAREAAFAVARLAESKRKNLWVALLGYNEPISDPKLTDAVKEEPKFPDAEAVAQYFICLANAGGLALNDGEAEQWAAELLPAGTKIDKEYMQNVRTAMENRGKCLLKGEHPAENGG